MSGLSKEFCAEERVSESLEISRQGGRRSVSLQRLRQDVRRAGAVDATLSHPYRREAVSVRVLQQIIFGEGESQRAPAHPHEGTAV